MHTRIRRSSMRLLVPVLVLALLPVPQDAQTMSIVGSKPSALSPPGSMYELYRPTLEYADVVSPLTSPLQYNHDSSIALFKSVWVAVWNANVLPFEGRANQHNVHTPLRTGAALIVRLSFAHRSSISPFLPTFTGL